MSTDFRGMYSAGYYGGQRLAALPEALEANRQDFKRCDDSEHRDYFMGLGSKEYHDGFDDGWHGRVPAFDLDLRRAEP